MELVRFRDKIMSSVLLTSRMVPNSICRIQKWGGNPRPANFICTYQSTSLHLHRHHSSPSYVISLGLFEADLPESSLSLLQFSTARCCLKLQIWSCQPAEEKGQDPLQSLTRLYRIWPYSTFLSSLCTYHSYLCSPGLASGLSFRFSTCCAFSKGRAFAHTVPLSFNSNG